MSQRNVKWQPKKDRKNEHDKEEDADSEDDERANATDRQMRSVQFEIDNNYQIMDNGAQVNADLKEDMEKHYLNEQTSEPQDANMVDEMNDMAANDPLNPLNRIPDNSNYRELDDMNPQNNNYQDIDEVNEMAANDPLNNQGMSDEDQLREGGDSEAPDYEERYEREREECKEDIDEEAGVQITEDYNPYSNFQDADDVPITQDALFGDDKKQEDDGFDEDDEREQDPEGNVHLEEKPCVLSFKVENNAAYRQTICFTIRPKTDNNGQPLGTLNFQCPASSIICEVGANQNCIVLNTTKIDPDRDDWGEFDWFFDMVENNIGVNVVNNQNNNNYNYSSINDTNETEFPMTTIGDQSSTGGAVASASTGGVKSCPVCTFDNPSTAFRCEICNSNL